MTMTLDLESDSEIPDARVVKVKIHFINIDKESDEEAMPIITKPKKSSEMQEHRPVHSLEAPAEAGQAAHTGRPSSPSSPLNGNSTPASRPTTPTSRPSTPTSRPSTPASRPSTPASRPSTPANRPSRPASQPSTSANRPSRPASQPSTSANRPSTPVNQPSTSASRPSMPAAHAGRSSSHTEKPISSKDWLRKYRLPKDNIPRGIVLKLENKEQLSTGDRRLFLEAIYHDVTKYRGGMYPTSDMYEDIVDGIVSEYPYLLTCGGLPATSARAYWKDKIIFKFGNARKSFDYNHPDVVSRKRKRTSKETNQDTEPEARNFTWGMENYLPNPPQSEDDASVNIHIESLKREFRKTSADVNITMVDQKMDLTFAHRRKMIVTEKIEMKNLLEIFPWLHLRHEILKEFDRLKPNLSCHGLEDVLSQGLKKYKKPILTLLKSKKKADFLKEVESSTSLLRSSEQRDYADDCLSIAGLSLLFKEKPEDIIRFEEDPTSSLYILVKEKLLSMGEDVFVVYIEGEKLTGCENFFQSLTTLLASIYVFNLAYPKNWLKTFTFIQNVLVGLKDQLGQVSLDKRILGVLASLNALISSSTH